MRTIATTVFVVIAALTGTPSAEAHCTWRHPGHCLKGAATIIVENIKAGGDAAGDLGEVAGEVLKTGGKVAGEVLKTGGKVAGEVVAAAEDVVEATGGVAEDVVEDVIFPVVETTGKTVVAVTRPGFEVAGKTVEYAIEDGLPGVLETTADTVDAVAEATLVPIAEEIVVPIAEATVVPVIEELVHPITETAAAAVEPKNLGKIAFSYVAVSFAGPVGAALASVLYDKHILGRDMTDEEMFRSFATGLAAGYAAQSAQGLVEGSGYMSNAAGATARNLVSDADAVLAGESYSSRDLLATFASSAAVVDAGDGFTSEMMGMAFSGGLQSTVNQVVDSGKVDMDRVTGAISAGLVNGVTAAGVHSTLDSVGVTDSTLAAREAFSNALSEALIAVRSDPDLPPLSREPAVASAAVPAIALGLILLNPVEVGEPGGEADAMWDTVEMISPDGNVRRAVRIGREALEAAGEAPAADDSDTWWCTLDDIASGCCDDLDMCER